MLNAVLLAAALSAQPASAPSPAAANQPAPSANLETTCLEDQDRDLCERGGLPRLRARLQVAPIETLLAAGVVARRAFVRNAFNRDMPMIAFDRRPGASPRVMVRVLDHDDPTGADYREMTAPISEAIWDDILQRTQFGTRTLVPVSLRGAVDGEVTEIVCMDGLHVRFEISDPRDYEQPLGLTERGCNGLAISAAEALARVAVAVLPPCNVLDRQRLGSDFSVLDLCSALEGDKLAAAEALNDYLSGIGRPYDLSPESETTQDLFDSEATVEWLGEPRAVGRAAAATSWIRHSGTGQYFGWSRFVGETGDTVRTEGFMTRGPNDEEMAAVTIHWSRDNVAFVVRSITVGAFVRRPPAPQSQSQPNPPPASR